MFAGSLPALSSRAFRFVSSSGGPGLAIKCGEPVCCAGGVAITGAGAFVSVAVTPVEPAAAGPAGAVDVDIVDGDPVCARAFPVAQKTRQSRAPNRTGRAEPSRISLLFSILRIPPLR